MTRCFDTYKDIPLCLIIKKDLRKRKLSQKDLARIIGVSEDELNHALNGKSCFSKQQAASIDRFFGYEESFTIRLQMIATSKKSKVDSKKLNSKIDSVNTSEDNPSLDYEIPMVRSCVFWDIDMQSLDWIRHQKFIERRIAQYGNQEEKIAIARFYSSMNHLTITSSHRS